MTAISLGSARVVSLAVNLPGPLAASRLSDLGAEVIKVEPPAGNPLAAGAPRWYAELAEGQKVIQLDLKDPCDSATLDSELVRSDVLITSHRPSALRPLGSTGARMLTDLLCELERAGKKLGLQTICEANGTANTTIVERI